MARHIASRVRTALENSKEEPALSVSIGVSVYPDNGRTAPDLLQAADRELYQHKRNSRARGASVT